MTKARLDSHIRVEHDGEYTSGSRHIAIMEEDMKSDLGGIVGETKLPTGIKEEKVDDEEGLRDDESLTLGDTNVSIKLEFSIEEDSTIQNHET